MTPVTIIDREHEGHVFFERDGRLFLVVTCGTTAVFDLCVELTPDERADYDQRGAQVVRELADQIRFSPVDHQHRHLPGVHP